MRSPYNNQSSAGQGAKKRTKTKPKKKKKNSITAYKHPNQHQRRWDLEIRWDDYYQLVPPAKQKRGRYEKNAEKKKVEKVEMKTSTTVKKKEREKRKQRTRRADAREARVGRRRCKAGGARERDRARAGEQCAARKKSAENWAEFATTKFYCSYCVVVLWS